MTGQAFGRYFSFGFAVAVSLLATGVCAQPEWHDPYRANQCFMESSQRTGIPYNLLLAVKMTESGPTFNPMVSRRNRKSVDIGMMQVNSSWLPMLSRFGVTEANLYDPCVNVDVASRILAYTVAKEGDWTRGIARYHTGSGKPWTEVQVRGLRYASEVLQHYRSLNLKIAAN